MSMALSRGPRTDRCSSTEPSTPVGRPGRELVGRRAPGAQAERPGLGAVARRRSPLDAGRPSIPMPIPGSAEAPGPLTVTSRGRWIACYAPYNTFDPSVVVDRNQIVAVFSDDEGRTWRHTSMLRFADPDAGGAEAWVVELSDGRLVGTCWSMSLATGVDTPIPFATLVRRRRDVDADAVDGDRRPGDLARAPARSARPAWPTTSARRPTRASGSRWPGPTDDDFGVERPRTGVARRAADAHRTARRGRPRRVDRLRLRRTVGDRALGRRRARDAVVRSAVRPRHTIRPTGRRSVHGRTPLRRASLTHEEPDDVLARPRNVVATGWPAGRDTGAAVPTR